MTASTKTQQEEVAELRQALLAAIYKLDSEESEYDYSVAFAALTQVTSALLFNFALENSDGVDMEFLDAVVGRYNKQLSDTSVVAFKSMLDQVNSGSQKILISEK
jgi:hypothetical protein